jgi:hypothetical protein
LALLPETLLAVSTAPPPGAVEVMANEVSVALLTVNVPACRA